MFSKSKTGNSFIGWRIAILAAICKSCGIGLFQGFGALVNPISVDMGVDPGKVGSGMGIFVLTITIISAIIGSKLDQGDIRKFMIRGILLAAVGFAGLYFSKELWQMGICLAIISAGAALYGPLSVTALAVRWFKEKRGTALAIVTCGAYITGFFVPVTTASLTADMGWRLAVILTGAIALTIAFIAAMFIVSDPKDVGQFKDGADAEPEEELKEEGETDFGYLKTSDFWKFVIFAGVGMAVPSAVGVYLVPALEDLGITPEKAAIAATLSAIAAFISTLVCGSLADRFSPKLIASLVLGGQTSALLLFYNSPSYELGLVAAIGMGTALGGIAPILPLLISGRFGANKVAGILGINGLFGTPLMAGGPIVAGMYRTSTGEYGPVFMYAAFFVVGAILALFAFKTKRPQEKAKLETA